MFFAAQNAKRPGVHGCRPGRCEFWFAKTWRFLLALSCDFLCACPDLTT
ncbi:hypothetical protein ACS15_1090 [Ralstonia insidiosa]|uniref:Uncharacterized protein n=1 Tax=Ralstonia insidiosa TaxID=190721 RepID=A0AAC9FT65_9RALS|nr:hypothetical protein ACS15_1090 [Ralstonia insidiosa]